MGLPDWLTVPALKLRLDKELKADNVLLGEMLEEAFSDMQVAPPMGCGRLLVADPPLVPSEEEGEPATDTADPVTRQIVVTGPRVQIPDAREITAVTTTGDADDPTTAITEYGPVMRDGVIIQLNLPEDDDRWRRFAWEPRSRRFPGEKMTVAVTGRFGFNGCGDLPGQVPPRVRGAIYTLAARMFYERQAQFADTAQVGEGAAVSIYSRALPAATRVVLEDFALPFGYGGLS